MERYQRVFNNVFVDGKYNVSFSIGSTMRDGQYLGLRINDCCYLVNLGYMHYFAFTPTSDCNIITQRSQMLLTFEKGCYSVMGSEVISDLIYRSCGIISDSKLQHYVIVVEEAILDIVVSQEITITEGELDLQLENVMLQGQSATLGDEIPADCYYFFTLYSTLNYKTQFYLLGLKNRIRVELDDMFAFYMVEEGIDLTGSPENTEYQLLPVDSTERYLYSIDNQEIKNHPTYCLHNLLNYNVYFYSEDVPRLLLLSS